MSGYFPSWNLETERRHRTACPALVLLCFKGLEEVVSGPLFALGVPGEKWL